MSPDVVDYNDIPESQRITIKWGGGGIYVPGTGAWRRLMAGKEAPYTIDAIRSALVEVENANVQDCPVSILDAEQNELQNAPGHYTVHGPCTVIFRMPAGSLGNWEEVSEEDFESFVSVQTGGSYNMFSMEAQYATGLEKKVFRTIANSENYKKLVEKYPAVASK